PESIFFVYSVEQLIEKCTNDIENRIQEKIEEILKIAEAARTQSIQAVTQANQATKTSQKSAKQATEAAASAQKFAQWAEQRSQEFQSEIKTCETTVKETAAAQKEFYERVISNMRTKIEHDFERTREAANESAASAKDSARIARESISA
ncbi:unnamed protein product, partial [Rotaria sp. Silwood2]